MPLSANPPHIPLPYGPEVISMSVPAFFSLSRPPVLPPDIPWQNLCFPSYSLISISIGNNHISVKRTFASDVLASSPKGLCHGNTFFVIQKTVQHSCPYRFHRNLLFHTVPYAVRLVSSTAFFIFFTASTWAWVITSNLRRFYYCSGLFLFQI